MASILDRYGIKEVADVTFYKIDDNGNPEHPVLYLDTLKVSTIEQTAETADARGGKGNPKLISWDYGKEINVTIEDALFSAKSMAIMFGNGTTKFNSEDSVTRTAVVRVGEDGKLPDYFVADIYNSTTKTSTREKVYMSNAKEGDTAYDDKVLSIRYLTKETGGKIEADFTGDVSKDKTSWQTIFDGQDMDKHGEDLRGQKVFVTYVVGAATRTITISGDSFPGTYYITGDTYARSDVTGADQFFQFVIPKAKVTSENTITLEAEGDPSVFSMNLTVLRPESGEMMKLVQYDLTGQTVASVAAG